jgi:hypothetical protein
MKKIYQLLNFYPQFEHFPEINFIDMKKIYVLNFYPQKNLWFWIFFSRFCDFDMHVDCTRERSGYKATDRTTASHAHTRIKLKLSRPIQILNIFKRLTLFKFTWNFNVLTFHPLKNLRFWIFLSWFRWLLICIRKVGPNRNLLS